MLATRKRLLDKDDVMWVSAINGDQLYSETRNVEESERKNSELYIMISCLYLYIPVNCYSSISKFQ